MSAFRLSYPSSIFATVVANDLESAKSIFLKALQDYEEGTDFDIAIEQNTCLGAFVSTLQWRRYRVREN